MDKSRIQLSGVLDQVISELRDRAEAISEAMELSDAELVGVADEPLHRCVRRAAAGYSAMMTLDEIAVMAVESLHWWVLQPCRHQLASMSESGLRMEDAGLYRVALAAVLAELRLIARQTRQCFPK